MRAVRLVVVFTLGLEVLFMAAVYVGAPLVGYLTSDDGAYLFLPWARVQRLVILAPILGLLLTIVTLLGRKR
jgi:hypothetical protein